jgi:hypothetical protein
MHGLFFNSRQNILLKRDSIGLAAAAPSQRWQLCDGPIKRQASGGDKTYRMFRKMGTGAMY